MLRCWLFLLRWVRLVKAHEWYNLEVGVSTGTLDELSVNNTVGRFNLVKHVRALQSSTLSYTIAQCVLVRYGAVYLLYKLTVIVRGD